MRHAPFPGVAEQRWRLDLFVESYGIAVITPADVITATIRRLRELVDFIVTRAREGVAAQHTVLERSDTLIYERDIAYLEVNPIAG